MIIKTDGSLKELKQYQLQYELKDFIQIFNHPFLVLESETNHNLENKRSFETVHIEAGQLAEYLKTPHSQKSSAKVLKVVKKGTNTIEGILRIGRAAVCDIVFNIPSISKLHAFFHKDAQKGSFYVSDADSKNGTYINNFMLPPNEKRILHDGDTVSFGQQIKFTFYTPAGFYELLKQIPNV